MNLKLKQSSQPGEVWKRIPNYANYLVSNYGRVWTTLQNRLISTGAYGKDRRVQAGLSRDDDQRRTPYLHRLVASAFIPEYFPRCTVNFIDGDPENCRLDNLEVSDTIVRGEGINQAILNVELNKVYHSVREAAEDIEGGDPRQVRRALNGFIHTHRGYTFVFLKETNND